MNMTIWKYELTTTDTQSILMPADAEVLTVQIQNGKPYLWALVDKDKELQERVIEIFGTGNPVHYGIGVEREYIGTYQLHNGALVFHVFEYIGF